MKKYLCIIGINTDLFNNLKEDILNNNSKRNDIHLLDSERS